MNCFSVRVSSVLLLRSKKHVDNVYTPSITKKEVLGKCFAPHKVGHVLTPIMQCTTVWISIFCVLVNDDTAVVMTKCFAPPNVGHVQTPFP